MTTATTEVLDIMPITELELRKSQLATIDTPEQAQAAGLYLREARDAIRKIKAKYVKIRKPVNDALKDLKKQEEEDLAPYLAAEVSVNQPLLAWQLADRVRVETERRAQLEQARAAEEAKRAEEVAALRAKAAATKGVERQVAKAQARALEVAPITPRVTEKIAEPTKIAGVSLSTRWSAEVFDFALLVQAVASGRAPISALEPNQEWLDGQAVALQNEMAYPGVQAVSKSIQTARGF